MKSTVLVLAVLVLAACSSSKKKEATATAEQAPTPVASKEAAKSKKATKPTKAATTSKADTNTAPGSIQCTNGTDKRILEIKPKNAKGCELHYTKMDDTQAIASQIDGNEKCVEVQSRIKEKLTASGFNCTE